jgi:hypothetical protein
MEILQLEGRKGVAKIAVLYAFSLKFLPRVGRRLGKAFKALCFQE